jgi:hypothetical protein
MSYFGKQKACTWLPMRRAGAGFPRNEKGRQKAALKQVRAWLHAYLQRLLGRCEIDRERWRGD